MNCHFSNIYFSIGSVVQWNGNSCLILIDLHDIHYIQVGEAMPLSDASVDAVVGIQDQIGTRNFMHQF